MICSLSLSHTHSHTHSLSLSHSHTLFSLCLSVSVSLSLSLLLSLPSPQDRWIFLMIAWGYCADMDVGSEGWRWMGPTLRYLLAPAYRVLQGRKYRGRLWYLAPEANEVVENKKEGEGEEAGAGEAGAGEAGAGEAGAGEAGAGEAGAGQQAALKACSHPCDVCRSPLGHGTVLV